MSWVKLDDAMGEHRKIKRALRKSRSAVALHMLGILHCSRYLTDGFVEAEFVEEILPSARERNAALAVLIESGLWSVADEPNLGGTSPVHRGYTIHDYLEHNPARTEVLARRDERATAGRRGGTKSRKTPKTQGGGEATASPPVGAVAEAVASTPDNPVPSRPVPVGEGEERAGTSATAAVNQVDDVQADIVDPIAALGDPLDGITDPTVREVVTILRACPRPMVFDPLLAGVTNTIAAFPSCDPIQAARLAVAARADPAYGTEVAAKCLRFAFESMLRADERAKRGANRGDSARQPSASKRAPKPWDGALQAAIDERRNAA